MSELEDKISEVLGDPEQMAQITRLAQSLMGGAGDTAGETSGSTEGAKTSARPAAMPDLASLGIDADMLSRITRLISSGSAQNADEQALLNAMRPYLSEKRRGKMDKAMKLARLARIARLAIGEMEDGSHA